MIKIKFCIWWNFGKPEIINTWAYVYKNNNGTYTVINDDCFSDCVKFAPSEKFFYND